MNVQLGDQKTEFESKVQSFSEQLRCVTADKERLETELEIAQRKFELTSVQQQEHVNAELQVLESLMILLDNWKISCIVLYDIKIRLMLAL